MATIVIIQARMGSSRLPGKSLFTLNGEFLLGRVIRNAQKITYVDHIIVATTNLPEDDLIEQYCNDLNIKTFRGDRDNLLLRFVDASNAFENNDNIIRLTADNPFLDIDISKNLFQLHLNNKNDYTSIDGLSHIVFEVINLGALRECVKLNELTNSDKEHVTPFFRNGNKIFKSQILASNFCNLNPIFDQYLTIDTIDDFLRIQQMLNDLREKSELNNLYNWIKTNIMIKNLEVDLNGFKLSKSSATYIIAEIGQNHNGNIEFAKTLIEMAKRCGANAVKFQKRDIDSELTTVAYNKIYDNPNSFGLTYGEHRRFLELNEAQHLELKEYANKIGITYFCTPCDIPSLELLERINCPFYKVASRDLTNIPLLEALGKTGKTIIISTGMATYMDIDDAINALDIPNNKLIIMQCTSEYPCKPENVNLNAIKTIEEKYNCISGLSDHTSGVIIASAASAIGVKIIEKHITLDRTMKGTDQPGSLEESGLKKLIDYINAISKAMGDGDKSTIHDSINIAKTKLGRSLVSKIKIKKGVILNEEMLCLKSPGDGILWRDRFNLIGKTAIIDIDENITLKDTYFE
jgi:sialic acid synthase